MEILESQVTVELSAVLASPEERQRYYNAYRSQEPIAVPELYGGTLFIILEMGGYHWDGAPKWSFHLRLRQFGATEYHREGKGVAIDR